MLLSAVEGKVNSGASLFRPRIRRNDSINPVIWVCFVPGNFTRGDGIFFHRGVTPRGCGAGKRGVEAECLTPFPRRRPSSIRPRVLIQSQRTRIVVTTKLGNTASWLIRHREQRKSFLTRSSITQRNTHHVRV